MKWSTCFYILIVLSLFHRCASQTSPGGGPKDSIPPILESSVPANNQKNFKGKSVVLNFKEFIKLKDAKEVIITPSAGKNVPILAKNKTLTITPKDGWKDSTTYSIAFRDAVQDITESLPAQNLHLAFSTGPVIDSLTISGTVAQVLKETIPERVTIALYQSDTFNIFKHTPSYFTETNKDGTFTITNLKPGKYHVYGFSDKNKNLKADSQTEFYGFQSDTVRLDSNTSKIQINLIGVDSRPLKVNNVRHNARLTTIKLSKPVSTYTLHNMEKQTALNTYGDNQTEILVYHDSTLTDSVAYNLTARDSISQLLDTVIFVKASAGRFVKDKFKVTLTTAQIDTETGVFYAELTYTVPLKVIQPDTVLIFVDSTYSIPIKPEDYRMDTASKKISFNCSIKKKALQELQGTTQLIVSKGVFISIDNDSSKTIRTPVPYTKEEETGKLSIEIKTSEPYYIIQLLDKDYKIIRQVRNQPSIDFNFLKPDTYKIRAIIDKNNNGKWDIGSYNLGIEPERIIYLKITPKTFDTPLRANWEATAPPFSF